MTLRVLLLLPLLAVISGCAKHLPSYSSLPFEQHTLRVEMAVGEDGSVALAQSQPLAGRIGLRPILEAEGMWPATARKLTVQLLVNYGRFYVVAKGFRSVWEITPSPGTSFAVYRPLTLVQAGQPPPKGMRLSRYGSPGSSCLRIDRDGATAVYVTREGKLHERCQ